jgi:hypothetical protein
MEPVGSEAGVVDDGPAQPAYTDHGDVPVGVDPENLPETVQQVTNPVATSLLTEASEIAKVLADLGGSDLEFIAQLLGTDH